MSKPLKLAILVYHQIVPDDFPLKLLPLDEQPYFSRLSEFYSHLDYLVNNNFSTLTIDEIGNPRKEEQSSKKIAITFDDGQISDYTIAFPAIIEREMKATFYIVTDFIGKKGWLNWDQLKEMLRYGMEIGSHSCSHRRLLDLKKEDILIELQKSKQVLEDRLGCYIRSFTTPFGLGNQSIMELALEAGYETICTSEVKLTQINVNKSIYGRIGIRRGDNVEKFKGIVEKEWQTIGKLIIEDRIKSLLKQLLGRRLWYKFSTLMISQSKSF
ncbi:MAG: polysaccharide deacetylase family protein [Candidatus Scalinduaceae bacterium]